MFLLSLSVKEAISVILVVTKPEGNCCWLPLKTAEEEIGEGVQAKLMTLAWMLQ